MSRLEDLIKELCPNGVEFKALKDVAEMRRGTPITRKDVSDGHYPVVAGGKEPAYYCDRYNREGDIITVAGSGANAGFIRYWIGRIFVSDAFSVKGKEGCSTMYLHFILLHMQLRIQAKKKGAGVPHVHIKDIESIQIPVPPLEVQKELVRIFEKLKDFEDNLRAELEAELEARRKQYQFYRGKLLDGNDQTKDTYYKKLGEVAEMQRGTPITQKDVSDGPFPVMAGGIKPAYFCDRYNRNGETIVVAGSGANAGFISYWRGPVFVSDAFSIKGKEGCLTRYLLHVLLKMQLRIHAKKQGAGVPHVHIKDLASFQIYVPPLSEQKRIVEILDKFSTLIDELSSALKRERILRIRYFWGCRDKLLTFKKSI